MKQRHRKFRFYRLAIKNGLRDTLLIGAGVLLAAFGLRSFLLPNHFLDGGVTGISLLVNILSEINISVLLVLLNAPFILLGWQQLSLSFAVKTSLAILCLALFLAVINFPVITSDKLLVALFGGFFLGAGIGLSIRGGSVLDGTEILALYISRQINLSVGEIILYFNILIFGVAAMLINVETALYAILTYLAASKTVDFFIHGFEEYIALTVISVHSELIRKTLTITLGKGVTVFKGKSGYGKRGNVDGERDIIYTVVTRLEVQKVINEIMKIDEAAFIVQTNINDTRGGMIKRRPLH